MLFHVEMTVRLPPDLPPETADRLKAEEKAIALDLQRTGVWRHLWRVVGRYANVSIFEVADGDALHTVLSGLPLFPFMDIKVTALARHPSLLEPENQGER